MLVSRGHMGDNTSTVMDEITQEDLDKINEALKNMPNTIIIAKPDGIPRKFKYWREYRKMTLLAVEEKTGISNAYISQLENGKIKKPSFDVVVKLLKCYGIRVIIN